MRFLPRFARDDVLREQLKLVTDSYLSSAAGFLTVCAVLSFITYRATSELSAIVWFIALVVVYSFWAIRQFKNNSIGLLTPRQVGTIEVIKVLVSNLIFCYFMITFMVATSPPIVVISIAIAAGGLSAGSSTMHGPCLPIFYSYTLPKMVVGIVALITLGGDINLLLAFAMILFLLLTISFARKIEHNIVNSIELRFENQDLVKQLRVTLTQADEANNAKSIFLSSASHDLRQPLHALALMVEVMGNSELSQQQADLQRNMMAAVNSTRDMLDSLLNMSKLEAGAISAKPKPFLIQTVFDRVDTEMWHSADKKDLSYRSRKTTATANSDILIVELIIRNLISNAIRYTNTGGILMACRKRKSGTLLIEVWDTGIGIQKNKTTEIFKPFHQLSNPERDSVKGFGLGLAITQKLAETIDSEIKLKSVEGRGSVFHFELPSSHHAVAPTQTIDDTGISFIGTSVLVIDDNINAKTSTQELVVSWGCRCISADSAADALSQLKNQDDEKNSIDIILADYRLRDNLTGGDAIKEIREFLGKKIPAIIITGDTSVERIQEASEWDAELLHKPVSIDQLKKMMNDLLPAYRVKGVGDK